MKQVFAGFLCLFSLQALADERPLFLDSTIGSKHFLSNKDHNEKNFGLGLTYEVANNREIRVGYYENSYYTTSTYALYNFSYNYKGSYYDPRWTLRYGIGFGLVHGYDGTDGEIPVSINAVQAAVVPNMIIGYGGFRATVACIGNAVALQLQMRIN